MVLAAGDISWPGVTQALPIVFGLLAYAALYLAGVRRLHGTSRAVPGWRVACFAGGLLMLLAALVSPLAGAADELFWAHMLEHLMIGDLAALLLVLGLTGPLHRAGPAAAGDGRAAGARPPGRRVHAVGADGWSRISSKG